MYFLIELLKTRNMRMKYISGFIDGWGKGATISMSNDVVDWVEDCTSVYMEGDFTTTNGPTFTDFPCDTRVFSSESLMWRGRLTRQRMQGHSWPGWFPANNTSATVLFKDTLEIMLLPKGAAPEYPDPSFGWTNFASQFSNNMFTWERVLTNVSTSTTVGATWSGWQNISPEDRWCPVRTVGGRYLVEPSLSHHWNMNYCNPATQFEIIRPANYPKAPVIISVTQPTATGTPTFVVQSGGSTSFVWTKPFSMTVNKSCKLVIDFTGNWSYGYVTGITHT